MKKITKHRKHQPNGQITNEAVKRFVFKPNLLILKKYKLYPYQIKLLQTLNDDNNS